MRTSFRHYESISRCHKQVIEKKGFYDVRQLDYKNSVLRKIWRIVRRSTWVGWKTYWQAYHQAYGNCFIKVSFGHDTLPREQACVDAENETRLSHYFFGFMERIPGVRTLRSLQHWMTPDALGAYYIVYPWLDQIKSIRLSDYLMQADNRATCASMLRCLSAIPAPEGWSEMRETHNFACTDYRAGPDVFSKPFNIDFFHNLAVDGAGNLLFFDLEKYQWSSPGLQEVTLALYLLSTQTVLMEDYMTCILQHVHQSTREAVMDQAWRVVENRRVPWRIPVLAKEEKYELTQRVLSYPCVSMPE